MGFRHRLALFLIVILVVVQGLSAVVAYVSLRQSLIEKEKGELAKATRVFARQLDLMSQGVTSDVKVLSLDYALRQAIAERDQTTEISALRNHGERVGAARMMIVGLDGRIEADTRNGAVLGQKFNHHDLLGDAMEEDQRTAIASEDGRVFWIVVVPVRAPLPIAFIAAFIPVDTALLQQLQQISSVPWSMALASADRQGMWRVIASTGGPRSLFLGASAAGSKSVVFTGEGGREYLTVLTQLKTASSSAPVAAVLGYPLDDALAPYWSTFWPVLAVFMVALIAAVAAAMLIVRSMSRPIEALAVSARRIAAGDYTPPPARSERDEVGQLSDALIAMTHSISEREHALTSAMESAETARAEAVSANAAKSNFLANMSHELRTPLNAIVGFGEMIQHQVLGPIADRRYPDYAKDIGDSAQKLLALISRMLDLADDDGGRLKISSNRFAPKGLITFCEVAARPFADKSGVILDVHASFDASLVLAGDEARLRQALSGLVHNAIKFTPAGGRVTVSANVEGESLALRVRDTGIGMKEEDVAVVTRPFHRLRSALDGRHQGAGLGLPFARKIVELHGGRFSIASAPMKGTTVDIVLPLPAGEKARAA
jgi:signal transduction histidine kinase